MQELQANTQVIVTVGPFVDVGDGFTPETGITLGAADEAELLKHGSTTVVDISAATWAAVTNCDGYYSLTLTTSHTDTEGMLLVVVQDDRCVLPVKQEYMVLSQAAWASKYGAKDSGYMDVDVTAISTDTTAANNAELFFDNTGFNASNSTVGTVTTNSDMRGTDSAALASVATEGRLSELDAANLPADVDAILVDTGTTIPATIATVDGNVDSILTDTGTTIPATIATVDGNVDSILTDTGTTLPATLATIDGKIDTVDTNVDAILVDTGTTLDAALAVVDANVDAILVDTGTTLDAALAVVDGNVDSILTDTGTTLPGTLTTIDGKIDTIDTNVDAVLVDTGTTLDAALAVVDGNVDSILTDTGTTIPGTITTLQADTDDIQTRLPAALVSGRMSSDAVAISGSTAAADNLEASAEVLVTGTAETGTLSTTVMTSSLTEATDDHYIGRVIIWTSGVLLGQATDITDYAGSAGTLTFTAVTEAPSNGDTFVIV